MEVKIMKISETAIIPKYAKVGDAGLDLTATTISKSEDIVTYGTGLAIEIPKGYVGLLFPRSSIYKTGLNLCNSVGVIDSGFRGEITLKFDCKNVIKQYTVGHRIGQIVIIPYPNVEFVEVGELSKTERGEQGYGSTNI